MSLLLLFRFPQPTTSKNKSFECDACRKVFSKKAYIGQHVQSQVKLAIHECKICGKSYKQKSNYQRHITRQHLHVHKRFECEICGKLFNVKSNLTKPKTLSVQNMASCSKETYNIITDYNINGQNLECVDSINDLGVTFDSELKFNIHIEAISKKAYRMLGFLIRSCKDFKNIKSHTLLYESLVKSQLNYCTVAWNQKYQKYVDHIEDIQRRFLKYMSLKFNIHPETTYEEKCSSFGLKSLKSIRAENDVVFLFKSLNNLLDSSSFVDQFTFSTASRETRNSRVFAPPTARTNLGLISPFYRMMSTFDDLNMCNDILLEGSLNSFKDFISNLI
jgi:transcription elongation factor Elf1